LLAKIDMLNSFFFFEAVTHAVVALVSRKYTLKGDNVENANDVQDHVPWTSQGLTQASHHD
jgi:hypothetical protein